METSTSRSAVITFKKKKTYGKQYDTDVSHYIGVKTKRYAKKYNLSIPDAYFLATSRAMRRRSSLTGSLETLMPYMLVSLHANRKRALARHNLGKFYFEPVLHVHFCIHDEAGNVVVQAEGDPVLTVHDETHSFLHLPVQGRTCIPERGEWAITVSLTDKDTGECVKREITGVYDLGYLVFKQGEEPTMDMFIDLHDSSRQHAYHKNSVPLARAVVKLVKADQSLFFPAALELYCDHGEPHQHHVHHHRCMRHLLHKHAKHGAHFHELSGVRALGADMEQPAPSVSTLDTLKEKLNDVMVRYTEAQQLGKRVEWALRDGTSTRTVQEIVPTSPEVPLYYDAHTITHVIMAAGLLLRLLRVDGHVEGIEPKQLHDPAFLEDTLGKDSGIVKVLRRIYVHTSMPTLSHLLLHTAGLPEYLPTSARRVINDIISGNITPPTEDEYVAILNEAVDGGLESMWNPGSVHHYSHVGYVIIGMVLQRLAQKPVKDVILEDARAIFGMSECSFIRYESEEDASKLVAGFADVLPGDPGVEAANRGLVVTATDMAAMAATFVTAPVKPEVNLLMKPAFQISKTLPLFSTYGGGIVDDHSVRSARTLKFHSYVEQGSSITIFVYPEYAVSFVYVTNVVPALVGTGYRARLHAQVLRQIVESGKYKKLAVINRSADTHEPAVDLPSGYAATVTSMVERLSTEENKKLILEEVARFLAVTGNRVFSSFITDASGNAEYVEFSQNSKHPMLVSMMFNGAPENVLHISPDVCPDKKMLWKVTNPEGLLTEPVLVWELEEPAHGTAVTVNGQVYFDNAVLEKLLAVVKTRKEEQLKSVDSMKMDIDPKYRDEVSKIGAPGWAWPFLGGLALGGLAGAAAYYPWYRRPAYYSPVYAYPRPVRRYPRWYYYPYIRGNVNETDKLDTASTERTKDYIKALKDGENQEEIPGSESIGARPGGFGGGRGGVGVTGGRVNLGVSARPTIRYSGAHPTRGPGLYNRGARWYGNPWNRNRVNVSYYGTYPLWANSAYYSPWSYNYSDPWYNTDPYYDVDPYYESSI